MLLSPGLADAQAGRTLASPGSSSTRTASLGRHLDAPLLTAPSLDPLRDWSLDVSAITSMPLSIGIEAQVETPLGVFGNLSVGHAPSAYLDAVDAMLQSSGVYGEDLNPLVSEIIGNGAWNVRLGVGVRPIEGLELSVGYTFLHAATALTPDTLERTTGERIRVPGMTEVPMAINVHALHGRVGWRFVLEEHLVIRAALGWTHAVAVDARVDVPDVVRTRPNDPATQIEDAVTEGFGEYGFTPEIIVGVGYRF
jgi:hypothetical protein